MCELNMNMCKYRKPELWQYVYYDGNDAMIKKEYFRDLLAYVDNLENLKLEAEDNGINILADKKMLTLALLKAIDLLQEAHHVSLNNRVFTYKTEDEWWEYLTGEKFNG